MHNYRVFNVSGKSIRGELSETGVLSYKRSWVTLFVTSRHENSHRDVKMSPLFHVATWITTSRRQFLKPLSRRDVRSDVATSKYNLSVTSRRGISRRDVIWSCPLSRRDVGFHVATSFGHAPCHVATWDFTSRRGLVWPLSRRDMVLHVATSSSITLCHVAT